jgi:hypothetical protein
LPDPTGGDPAIAVGIQDQPVTSSPYAFLKGSFLAGFGRVQGHEPEARVVPAEGPDDFRGPVAGMVIHQDELKAVFRVILPGQVPEKKADVPFFIAHGYHQGNARAFLSLVRIPGNSSPAVTERKDTQDVRQ